MPVPLVVSGYFKLTWCSSFPSGPRVWGSNVMESSTAIHGPSTRKPSEVAKEEEEKGDAEEEEEAEAEEEEAEEEGTKE